MSKRCEACGNGFDPVRNAREKMPEADKYKFCSPECANRDKGHTGLTPADLEKLEALAKDATPGPWDMYRGWADWGMPCQHDIYAGKTQIAGLVSVTPYCMGAKTADKELAASQAANAAYIAAANPAVVLSLLREIKVLRRALVIACGLQHVLEDDCMAGAEAQVAKEEG